MLSFFAQVISTYDRVLLPKLKIYRRVLGEKSYR